ncbi:MAG: hypothetical protein WD342_00550 [Verrucomicrobiales bacterium]
MIFTLRRTTTVAASLSVALLLCQCETTRTVKSTRSSVTFDKKMWGGQGAEDSAEIRSKFAERGYEIEDDGTIKADNPDLYADKKARGVDKAFGQKKARFKKTEADTKTFKTPEYLVRQEFSGPSEARESQASAREGNFGKSGDRQGAKLFKSKSRSTTELASYQTGTDRESGESFRTGSDRAASTVAEAPRAQGAPQNAGYKANASLTMDDVKKMLDPGTYARRKGLAE